MRDQNQIKLIHAGVVSSVLSSKTLEEGIRRSCFTYFLNQPYIDGYQSIVPKRIIKRLNRASRYLCENNVSGDIANTCLTASLSLHMYASFHQCESEVVYGIATDGGSSDGVNGKVLQHAWLECETSSGAIILDPFNQYHSFTEIDRKNYMQQYKHEFLTQGYQLADS